MLGCKGLTIKPAHLQFNTLYIGKYHFDTIIQKIIYNIGAFKAPGTQICQTLTLNVIFWSA